MRNKKVTLKRIADRLGMTPATISKALRDSSDISLKTKETVKRVADEMGYHPNIMARSLVRRQSYMLGVIVPDLRISFFSEAVRGIYERCRMRGYEAIIMANDDDIETEKRNLQFLSSLPVDGILINAAPGTENNGLLKSIHDQGIPFVAYDRLIDEFDTSSVTIDDEGMAFKVVEYFVQNGRHSIVFLGPIDQPSVARDRYKGYLRGLQEFGIRHVPEWTAASRIEIDDANRVMGDLLDSGLQPDAVLCVGGLIAYGGGRAILQRKLRIPDDILLAEFGDNDIVARLGVPFVTVNQSPYEMGNRAVDLLLDEMTHKSKPNPLKHVIIDGKLIFRTLH
jgi:DNA-binding LacI/PurR family transcriptional regulator